MVSTTNSPLRLEAKVEVWVFDGSLDVKRLDNWLRLKSHSIGLQSHDRHPWLD